MLILKWGFRFATLLVVALCLVVLRHSGVDVPGYSSVLIGGLLGLLWGYNDYRAQLSKDAAEARELGKKELP